MGNGRLVIAGSRSIPEARALREIHEALWGETGLLEVVSGGAEGPDRAGEKWARCMGLQIARFDPDWKRYGRSAGHRRNAEMAEYAGPLGLVLVVWDGQSRGSEGMIQQAKRVGCRLILRTPLDSRGVSASIYPRPMR